MTEPKAEPRGQEAAGGNSERDEAPAGRLDLYEHFQSSRSEPRSITALPGLTRAAVKLARTASPKLFWVVMSAQVLSAALLGLQVLLGKVALEAVLTEAGSENGSIGAALLPLIALALASAIASLVTSGQTLLQRLLGERVQQLSWKRILGVTTTVGLAEFETPAFFDDLERVKVNAIIRPLTMATGLVQVVGGALSVIGLGVTLFVIAPLLLPILVVGGVPLWWLSRKGGKLEFDFARAQTPERRLRGYYEGVLSKRDEAKEVRAFDLGDALQGRWETSYQRYFSDLGAHVRHRLLLAAGGALITAVATSLALGLLIYLVVEDRVGLATAGAAVIAIRLFAGRIQQLFAGIGQLFESSLFLRDLERFLTKAPPEPASTVPDNSPPDAPLDVEADRVSFRYPGSHRDALSDVSIRIGHGEVIALVGENGSGKTTLAKLIAQLYEPTEGRVLWSGTDSRKLDVRALRRRVGVIFQDFVRYELSARDNIGLADHERLDDLERIVLAARRGGVHEHLSALPEGYETGLGKEFTGGYDLSGGQWQRVALARAFFRDAELLVLDEPTASLDARSEHEIFEHVRELADGRSLVLISHRFSTVRSADRIYVLAAGRVIEEGAHDELMALGGHYAEMFDLQARAYR